MVQQPIKTHPCLLGMMRIFGHLETPEMTPGEIAHSFGRGMRFDSKQGANIDGGAKHGGREDPFEGPGAKGQPPQERHLAISRIVGPIVLTLDPEAQPGKACFNQLVHRCRWFGRNGRSVMRCFHHTGSLNLFTIVVLYHYPFQRMIHFNGCASISNFQLVHAWQAGRCASRK